MDGIIIINKEKEYTSNDVVQIVKHILNEKVGHTGTLDPNATGVLPILVGKGTKISKYLINHDKIYDATLKLGIKTDTGDGEGQVLQELQVSEEILQEENVINVLKSFKGKQTQIPPIYSAIKVNGKKLYDYARQKKEVEIPTRNIEIYDLQLKNIDIEKSEIQFRVECSKGTYIRTLCEDIAIKLGSIGYMKELDRIQVGEFNIHSAIMVNELKENKDNTEFLRKHIISIEDMLKDKDKMVIKNNQLKAFLNGVKITVDCKDEEYRVYDSNNKFIGTGIGKDGRLKRDIII